MTPIESRVLGFIIVHFSAPAFTQSNVHAKPLEKNDNTRHAPQSSRSLFTESLASRAVECYSPSPTLQSIRHLYFGQVFRLALKQSNQTLTPTLCYCGLKCKFLCPEICPRKCHTSSTLSIKATANTTLTQDSTQETLVRINFPQRSKKTTTTVPKRRRRKPLQTTRQPNAIHIPRS